MSSDNAHQGNGSPELSQSQLRWRCRRGMQELDLVLGRWLDDRWPTADATMREAFTSLLECEDDRIWSWLMQRDTPDESLTAIIKDLREQATPSGRE